MLWYPPFCVSKWGWGVGAHESGVVGSAPGQTLSREGIVARLRPHPKPTPVRHTVRTMGSTHGDGGSRATPLRDVEAAIPAPVGPAEVSAAPQGVVVVVEQLDYSVPGRGGGGCWRRSGGGDIYLLQGVSAHLPATQLTAIIGPSGCGARGAIAFVHRLFAAPKNRSTSCREDDAAGLGGRSQDDGQAWAPVPHPPQRAPAHSSLSSSQRCVWLLGWLPCRPVTALPPVGLAVAYTEQQDTLLPMLTTREMLLYTAHLKHGRRRSLAEKQAQVEELICKWVWRVGGGGGG